MKVHVLYLLHHCIHLLSQFVMHTRLLKVMTDIIYLKIHISLVINHPVHIHTANQCGLRFNLVKGEA